MPVEVSRGLPDVGVAEAHEDPLRVSEAAVAVGAAIRGGVRSHIPGFTLEIVTGRLTGTRSSFGESRYVSLKSSSKSGSMRADEIAQNTFAKGGRGA